MTTTALALTLSAPGRCLLAECDPSGGDVLAGYLQGALPAGPGLAPLAVAQLRGRLAEEFDGQLVDLDAPRRRHLLLPGVTDPAQSATVASVWEPVAEHLHHWQAGGAEGVAGRVVVDCGRVSGSHFGGVLVRWAAQVLLVVRPTLPAVAAAVPALRALHALAGSEPERGALGLVVVGTGPYPPSEVADRLGVPLVARLPRDDRAAAALSFGGAVHHRMPLLRAAARLHTRPAGEREAAGV